MTTELMYLRDAYLTEFEAAKKLLTRPISCAKRAAAGLRSGGTSLLTTG